MEEARALLARPDSDFCWSSWEDATAALFEVDGVLNLLKSGAAPDLDQIMMLFVVTGPICEVAVSSGWGEEYVRLGGRCDRAVKRFATGR